MSIGRAFAKIENIDRRIFLKGERLHIIDTFDDNRIVGEVRQWNARRLNPLASDGAEYEFLITQTNTGVATAANLARYQLVYKGSIYNILVRDAPEGKGNVLWSLKGRSTGEKINV